MCGLADPIQVQAPTVINNNYITPSPAPTPTVSAKNDPDEIEVTDVVSQGGKTVVKLMSDEEFYELKNKHSEKMDGEPELEARMTKLQATCFQLLLKAMLIYVDSVVWVPLYGPSCSHDWEASHMLFRTARIAFGAIGAELLGQYLRKVRAAAKMYPDAWALIH